MICNKASGSSRVICHWFDGLHRYSFVYEFSTLRKHLRHDANASLLIIYFIILLIDYVKLFTDFMRISSLSFSYYYSFSSSPSCSSIYTGEIVMFMARIMPVCGLNQNGSSVIFYYFLLTNNTSDIQKVLSWPIMLLFVIYDIFLLRKCWLNNFLSPVLLTIQSSKWNESGFRSLLRTYRLNCAKRTSWGWWDEWDDTALQTQDSKFKP